MKQLKDYSIEDIQRFDKMFDELKRYNSEYAEDPEKAVKPNYTATEMAEYSIYRELVIAKECEE